MAATGLDCLARGTHTIRSPAGRLGVLQERALTLPGGPEVIQRWAAGDQDAAAARDEIEQAFASHAAQALAVLGLAEDEASQVAFVLIRALPAGQPAKADGVRGSVDALVAVAQRATTEQALWWAIPFGDLEIVFYPDTPGLSPDQPARARRGRPGTGGPADGRVQDRRYTVRRTGWLAVPGAGGRSTFPWVPGRAWSETAKFARTAGASALRGDGMDRPRLRPGRRVVRRLRVMTSAVRPLAFYLQAHPDRAVRLPQPILYLTEFDSDLDGALRADPNGDHGPGCYYSSPVTRRRIGGNENLRKARVVCTLRYRYPGLRIRARLHCGDGPWQSSSMPALQVFGCYPEHTVRHAALRKRLGRTRSAMLPGFPGEAGPDSRRPCRQRPGLVQREAYEFLIAWLLQFSGYFQGFRAARDAFAGGAWAGERDAER